MCSLLAAGALLTACVGEPEVEPDLPDDLLAGGEDFIQVRRQPTGETADAMAALGGAPIGLASDDNSFYLAIRKDALARRWFLSAYTKQYHPGNAGELGAASLGTRVVSFRVQNDKIFVFDSSDQFQSTEIFDPEILLEAYPIVEVDGFDRLRGARDYVVFDPAAGQNRFLVTGELYADPNLADFGAIPLIVSLSYMQNFRAIPDGATYEQVFAGQIDLSQFGIPPGSRWGTLGVSLRRYQVGEGFVPTPDPGIPHYFYSDSRLVSDSGGAVEANPIHWNLHPGRPPIQVFITAGAFRAQADFPEFDILGALERGIENWNDVVGYRAFDAILVDDDEVRDDDKSTALIDYPGSGLGFAFADWRSNPNNGEVLGASVYMSGVFFTVLPRFQDDPAVAPPALAPAETPAVESFLWGGMPARRAACVYPALDPAGVAALRADTSLTAPEKGANYIEHVMSHEWGHIMGLRHNFKGSLEPPTSTVMDYLNREDRARAPRPGSYDIDAVRWLYQLSDELPTQPFCTDDLIGFDPNCTQFDETADPLHDFWPASYGATIATILDDGVSVFSLFGRAFSALAVYVGDEFFVDPADRLFAVQVLLTRTQVPLAADDAADPAVVARANDVLEQLIPLFAGLTEPGIVAFLGDQWRRMAVNEDGVRTFSVRRTAVDGLKALQTESGLLELRAARDAVATALEAGEVPAEDVPLTEDLLARIDAALSPYFF